MLLLHLPLQWFVQTSLYQPMEHHLCTVTPLSPELRAPRLPTPVTLATRWLDWWWGRVLSVDGALEMTLSVLVRGDECICANSVLIVRPSQPPVLSSPSPMEWSATVQLPPPYSREPWLHTAVLSLGTNCPHPHLLGPVSLTEHGVEMTSLVKVSCIDLLIILHTMMLIVSCGLWQSSGDLKWNTPIFCNYIWRDCHLHVQWNLCSIRKLHYLHV